jgi:hypothetical protein
MQSLLANKYPCDLVPPKYELGMELLFEGHGVQVCVGMVYCLVPGEEGWWYYYHEDYDTVGIHEEYVSLQPVYQTVTRPTMNAIPVT